MPIKTEADGTITVANIKATKTSELKKELKALQTAIFKVDCFGVRDLQLASMIGMELEERSK